MAFGVNATEVFVSVIPKTPHSSPNFSTLHLRVLIGGKVP
jgi:hypothetical protein